MIVWTHPFDLIAKLLTVAACVAFVIATGLGKVLERMSTSMPSRTLFMVLSFLVVGMLFYVLLERPFLDVLATSAYVRFNFGSWPSWSEARELRTLFTLNRHNTWHPMRDVMVYPREERLPALLSAARALNSETIRKRA